MSATQRDQLTVFIKYAHLFRVTLQGDNTENMLLDSSHPLVLAFKQGLLWPSFETQLDLENASYFGFCSQFYYLPFSQVFANCVPPIDLIASLYKGRQIAKPDQVIDRIEVNAVSTEAIGYDEEIHHSGMVKRFKRLLEGYLRGLGHPRGAQKLGISAAAIKSNKDDKHLRPQLFVETLTASSYLPIHNSKISVSNKTFVVSLYIAE